MPGGRLPTLARAMREYAQLDSGTRHVHLRTGRIFSTGQPPPSRLSRAGTDR